MVVTGSEKERHPTALLPPVFGRSGHCASEVMGGYAARICWATGPPWAFANASAVLVGSKLLAAVNP